MSQFPPPPPPWSSSPPPHDQEVSPEDFAQLGTPKRTPPAPIDDDKARRRKKILLTVALIVVVLGIGYWVLSRAGLVGAFASADQPRRLAQEFVKLASEGANESAMRHAAPGFSFLELERQSSRMREWGAFQDLTTWSSSLTAANGVSTCRLEGVAVFGDGEHPFSMELIRDGDAWKVSMLEID